MVFSNLICKVHTFKNITLDPEEQAFHDKFDKELHYRSKLHYPPTFVFQEQVYYYMAPRQY